MVNYIVIMIGVGVITAGLAIFLLYFSFEILEMPKLFAWPLSMLLLVSAIIIVSWADKLFDAYLPEESIVQCRNCEETLDAEYAYCPYCGKKTDAVPTCPSCGAEWNSAYCGDCGSPMNQEG